MSLPECFLKCSLKRSYKRCKILLFSIYIFSMNEYTLPPSAWGCSMLTTGVLLENLIVRANACVLTQKLTPQCNAHKRWQDKHFRKKFQPTMQVAKSKKIWKPQTATKHGLGTDLLGNKNSNNGLGQCQCLLTKQCACCNDSADTRTWIWGRPNVRGFLFLASRCLHSQIDKALLQRERLFFYSDLWKCFDRRLSGSRLTAAAAFKQLALCLLLWTVTLELRRWLLCKW